MLLTEEILFPIVYSCLLCYIDQLTICVWVYFWTFFFFLLWLVLFIFFKCYFIFKLYIIVLVLPNIKMNLPQVYMCSPSWTLLPPPSPYHPSGSSQCTSPKHPVSCIEPGLAFFFFSSFLDYLGPLICMSVIVLLPYCFDYCSFVLIV